MENRKNKTNKKKKKKQTDPETKTPVPRRKNKPREAVKTSHLLSGLTPKRCGTGGLKSGGGAKVTDDDGEEESPWSLVEVVRGGEVSEELVDALMVVVILGILRYESGLRSEIGGERLRAVAMVFFALQFGQKRVEGEASECFLVVCVWIFITCVVDSTTLT